MIAKKKLKVSDIIICEKKLQLPIKHRWHVGLRKTLSTPALHHRLAGTKEICNFSCSRNFFLSRFSFTDTDESQNSGRREGAILITLYDLHLLTNFQTIFWTQVESQHDYSRIWCKIICTKLDWVEVNRYPYFSHVV